MSSSGELLDDLAAVLTGPAMDVSRMNGSLVAKHRGVVSHLDIVDCEESDSPMGPVKCVVQLRSDLPDGIVRFIFDNPKVFRLMNRIAGLGALTIDGDLVFVGSRLTILESADAGAIHLPLLAMAVLTSAEAIISGTGELLAGRFSGGAVGAWTEDDFSQVEEFLAGRCVCSSGDRGFTAEFPLKPEAVSAMAGDRATALWRLKGDEGHPGLGAGLFGMLQLPHSLPEGARRDEIIRHLNQLEMQAYALPPHFGSWCLGQWGNPAYVSFLPDELHDAARGIAVNMSVWASFRAQWANVTLASMGILAGSHSTPAT